MIRIAALALLVVAAGAPVAEAASPQTALRRDLAAAMRSAGPASGAYVAEAAEGRTFFADRSSTPRILASNTKLFVTATALARLGTEATLPTSVLAIDEPDGKGVLRGHLHLRGGGDPTFGSRGFARRAYGRATGIEDLAARVSRAGIESVSGRVVGDESLFDRLRGTPATGFRSAGDIGGPLTALSYNRGLANEFGSAFQVNPAAFAAARLTAALEARGVNVRGAPSAGPTPARATVLATVQSPSMARLAQLTNKPSDNLLAELLAKRLSPRGSTGGSTAGGVAVMERFARRLGSRARLTDGSGLDRGNQASPRAMVRLLRELRARDEFAAFRDSLPVAGRDGTLRDRMRRGAARGRCRAKTGTLRDVSALSGYCQTRRGGTLVFSIIMNRTSPGGARNVQDRMANLMAAYRG